MYIHHNSEQNQPYSCVMITPSAPPVNEDFFYPGSPSGVANKKANSDSEDAGHSTSSSNSVPNISYSSGLLAPISSSNDNNTGSSSFSSEDQFDSNNNSRPYHRYNISTNHRRNEQYESLPPSPPPYQESHVLVPLLAAQEDDENSEQNTETTPGCITHHNRRQQQSSANNLVDSNEPYDGEEYNKSAQFLYYTTRRESFFSPRWFTVAFFFFILGLALVIASIIMVHQCTYQCEIENDTRKSDEALEDDIMKFCDRKCHGGTAEIFRDVGACITGVAGFASVVQLFLLSMWQIQFCCTACCRK